MSVTAQDERSKVTATLAAALAYVRSGLSIVPIKRDGSKRPHGAWKAFQSRPPTETELQRWFGRNDPFGIAILGGKVSGNLELIDFDVRADELFPAWCELIEAESPGLLARLNVVRTPRPGYHVRYRVAEFDVPGNTKLAQAVDDGGEVVTLIETRGEGGYGLVPGTPAGCHETGRLYVHHSGPKLSQVETITAAEREILIRAAWSFEELIEFPELRQFTDTFNPTNGKANGRLKPGDDFNRRGTEIAKQVEDAGWTKMLERNGVIYWRRPGKSGKGWSATTGHCRAKSDGRELFAVFSSNASPFPGPSGSHNCSCHDRFSVYTLLNHAGDFKAAAKSLGAQGYGEQGPKVKVGKSSANGDGANQSDDQHTTDIGNAQRVIARHGRDIGYCFDWKQFLTWDGLRFVPDNTGAIVRFVKETQADFYRRIKLMIGQLADGNKEQAKALQALLSHALKWEDARRVSACIEMMKSEPGIPITPAEMDRDGFKLNVLNGTIDLRTGALLEHRREDRLTKLAPVTFDPAAQCPLWLKFLNRIMDGNNDLLGYLQRVTGYALTADVGEQVLFFFYGTGANGKSVFLNTIRDLLGDYGIQAVSELLMAKSSEAHPTERADLFGKRMVATIETDEGKRLAEALMKQLTGGEKLRARKLYQDFFEIPPTWKIFLAANHKPVVRGCDFGVWRRIKLVPFTVKITDEEKDTKLTEKLRDEWPGILNWALKGCLDWQAGGLGEPEEVKRATDAYAAEQDTIAEFIASCCFTHREAKIKLSLLFDAYVNWSGDKIATQRIFAKRLGEKGFDGKRGHGGYVFIRGIGLEQTEPTARVNEGEAF